jgi:hypothetical protein
MPRVLYVTMLQPIPLTNGGTNRSYQIKVDLENAFEPDNIQVLSLPDHTFRHWVYDTAKTLPPLQAKALRYLHYQYWRVFNRNRLDNPHHKNYFIDFRSYAKFRAIMTQFKPDAVVIEQPHFERILEFNGKINIPTLICPQNLEAFVITKDEVSKSRANSARFTNFAHEMDVFTRCAARGLISRLEHRFIESLGIPCDYYPYQPVGLHRQMLLRIREKRRKSKLQKGLYVLMGSVAHPPVGLATAWWIQQATQYGLPDGVRVIILGRGAERFIPAGSTIPNVEVRSWIESTELEALLTEAQGALVPYVEGFGALTRISDLLCAGVPIIASTLATAAVDPDPLMLPVENKWQAWHDAMHNVMTHSGVIEAIPNESPSILSEMIKRIL